VVSLLTFFLWHDSPWTCNEGLCVPFFVLTLPPKIRATNGIKISTNGNTVPTKLFSSSVACWLAKLGWGRVIVAARIATTGNK
jgi:hypothetical protein